MSDWTKPFDVTYRIMRVNRVSKLEVGIIPLVLSGGSIDRNLDTDIVECGSITVEGKPELGNDYVRVWADVEWRDGSTDSVPLGTFLPNVPRREINGGESSSPVELDGLLQELADDMFENPITIPAGEYAVDQAANICRQAGLDVAPYTRGEYRLSEAWTFGMRSNDQEDRDKGTTKLDAVNDLLALAGYSAARTDVFGRVVLEAYVPPAQRRSSWSFEEGPDARFVAQMTEERDLRKVANVVKVTYWDSEREVTAIAVDDDPDSEFSTVARGRRICEAYEYSNVPEGMGDKELNDLAYQTAVDRLHTSQAVIHRVVFTHAYAPVGLNDVVDLTFPTGRVNGSFAIRTQHISLDAGIPVECEGRKFQRARIGG